MKKPLIGVTTSFEDREHLENQICNPFYPEAVRLAGGEPMLLDFLAPLETIPDIVSKVDGILLIGGGDVLPSLYGAEMLPECGEPLPVKDYYEIALAKETVKQGKPLLGICRGIQVINVAFGGTLIQDLPSAIGQVHQQPQGNRYWHDVDILPGTLMHSLLGKDRIATNSYHHQAVDRVAECMTVSARNHRDGTIEALESKGDNFILGLQWHPERTVATDTYSIRYFKEFVRRAANA